MTTTILEGEDWKNFTFRLLTSSDFPALSQHMKDNFYPDEPISAILGTSEEKTQDYDRVMKEIITENLSIAAFDKEFGKMAAVCLSSGIQKNAPKPKYDLKSTEVKITVKFFQKLDESFDICTLYNVQKYASLRIASVHRDFRGQGLATELFRRVLQFYKREGYLVAKSIFSNIGTRAAGKRMGFEELGRRYNKEIEDLNGVLIRPEMSDDQFSSFSVVRL